MDRISAAGNLTIEMSAERWRLLVNGTTPEQVLVEAAAGQSLRYIPMFAHRRRLPDTGVLPVDQIQRVVLGWSNEDETWHLGLLLGPDLAQMRGSRWCEMARWPDPDATTFVDLAAQAGQSLAKAIGRPFNYIPPQEKPAQAVVPPRPLPELPLTVDIWTLDKTGDSLEFKRAASWARSKVIRALWYLLLVIAYVVLSLMSLTQIIALPKPEFLPYLGLVVAVLLLIMAVQTLFQVIRAPNRILVDGSGVRAKRGSSERWKVGSRDVQSVYVSQVVGKKGSKRTVHYGELNLHLGGGRYRRLLNSSQSRETSEAAESGEAVVALTPDQVHTDLQAAAAYVAQKLGVPCWYDRRSR